MGKSGEGKGDAPLRASREARRSLFVAMEPREALLLAAAAGVAVAYHLGRRHGRGEAPSWPEAKRQSERESNGLGVFDSV